MKYLSISLIVLGLLVGLFALNMDVTAEGTNVVNLNLLSLRQNYLTAGGILFIAGIILVTSFQRNKVQEKDLIIKSEDTQLTSSKILIMTQYWKLKSLGDKVILISFIVALFSLILDWSIIYVANIDYSHGSKASVRHIITLVVIWFYPIFMAIKNKPIPFRVGLLLGVVSLGWIVREISISNTVNTQLNGTEAESITFLIGNGMYFVVAASVLFLTGLLLKKMEEKK